MRRSPTPCSVDAPQTFREDRRRWLQRSGLAIAAVSLPGTVRGDDPTESRGLSDESSDGTAAAQPSAADAGPLSYDSPRVQRWQVGMILETGSALCQGVFATFPIPREWPEQKVRLVDQNVSPAVAQWQPRTLPGDLVEQIVVRMATVAIGAIAEATFTFEVERSRIVGPEQTEEFRPPRRVTRELRFFTGSSPYINVSDPRLKAAAREVAPEANETAWQHVERIYDYVREKIQYTEGPIKSASEAMRDGTGDCEELTSAFIALCRIHRIPARMVWIPGHCYPEFYLEDAQGEGHWFPCQAAGTRQFGGMDEYRPVLQKGDQFKVPEKREVQRYVAEFCKIDATRGSGKPKVRFVRELLD